MNKKSKCFIFGCKETPSDKTRESLLIHAKKAFAEHGFEGASLREICHAANANVSSVKYHFGDKETLFRTCLSEYAESRLAVVTKILTPSHSLQELRTKLTLFAEDFMTESLLNLDMTKMLFREIENMNTIMEGIFEETFLQFYKQLAVVLADAQTNKLIRQDISIEATTSIFFHYLTQTIRTNHIAKKYFKRDIEQVEIQKENIKNLIQILFDGITPQEHP